MNDKFEITGVKEYEGIKTIYDFSLNRWYSSHRGVVSSEGFFYTTEHGVIEIGFKDQSITIEEEEAMIIVTYLIDKQAPKAIKRIGSDIVDYIAYEVEADSYDLADFLKNDSDFGATFEWGVNEVIEALYKLSGLEK